MNKVTNLKIRAVDQAFLESERIRRHLAIKQENRALAQSTKPQVTNK
jgi:hypothetical protein